MSPLSLAGRPAGSADPVEEAAGSVPAIGAEARSLGARRQLSLSGAAFAGERG